MKKISLLLFCTVLTSIAFAQKTDTEKRKTKISIPKSELFKGIQTYNIVIQGDDSWNTDYADKKKLTYEHNLTNNTIEDYSKKDTINPDIRMLMGYKGATYKSASNGQFLLDGDFKYLALGKNNEILFEKGINATMYSPTYNGKPYTSLVNDLNNVAYKVLTDNNLIVNEKEYSLNYGLFEKAEDFPELIAFNTKTDEFLKKIEMNSLDKAYLSDLEQFYLTYVGKEYKKLKAKEFNKVLYLNLSLTQLFAANFDKSLEYLESAKQGAGMLSLWPVEAKSNIESFILVNSKINKVQLKNPSFDSAYYIYIDGSVTKNGKTQEGKLKTDRFPNSSEGSILSSDDPTKPKVWIYKDNGEVDFILVDATTTIKTKDGLDLRFIPFKNNFILVEKTGEACYKKYESISTLVYCDENGKFEVKK